jgi:hypothetical protein
LQPATTISIAIAEWHPEALIQRAEALDDDKLKEKEALTQQAAPSVREVCESPPFEETTHEVFEFFCFCTVFRVLTSTRLLVIFTGQ